MEKDKSKSREPFSPENTPQPPQEMDPSREPEGNRKQEQPNASADKQSGSKKNKDNQEEGKEKRLGESPIEIDDETTI